jgi:hypothetical protein
LFPTKNRHHPFDIADVLDTVHIPVLLCKLMILFNTYTRIEELHIEHHSIF